MPAPVEGSWVAAFVEVLRLCGVQRGDACAVLSETQSRAVLVDCARLSLQQLGATVFEARVPTPPVTTPVPVRSTGASLALTGQRPLVEALALLDQPVPPLVFHRGHYHLLGEVL